MTAVPEIGAQESAATEIINRVDQSERFLVRQNRLFHLVHHVRECDFVFRIGKGVTATGTGMSKGCCGWSKHLRAASRESFINRPRMPSGFENTVDTVR
jgi:hypothetical protein